MNFNSSRLALGLVGGCIAFGMTAAAPTSGTQANNEQVLARTSEAFHQAAQRAVPSVVSISALKQQTPALAMGMPGSPGGGGGMPAPGEDMGAPFSKGLGIGSGVIIRADGIILTSHHLVENAEKVTVSLPAADAGKQLKPGEKPLPERKVEAKVLGSDPRSDLAVLKIIDKVENLPTIEFANSDTVKVGDWAIAVGNPFGLAHSVTSGIISAKGRASMGVFDIEDFIQTDAAINPGNSGGPLLNISGQMIGLNAAIFSQTGSFIGIGFSIPSNLARQVAEEIMQNGRVIRGWMGVMAQDLDEDLSKYFQVDPGKGALISQIAPNSPAERARLKSGDVVMRFGSDSVVDSGQLRALVAKTKAGSEFDVQVMREGKKKSLKVKITEQPAIAPPPTQLAARAASPEEEAERASFGLTVQDVPEELRKLLGRDSDGLKGALVVNVRPGSRAFDAGLSPGDIILRANAEDIKTAAEFARFAKKQKGGGQGVVLYVQRGPDDRIFVPVKG